jgi:16S rRNA (guanine966-N2)-methyltransferase
MRVVAGKAKGANLRSVPGDTTRPITDRVKRSLFDILGADVEGSRWLDLFGGTGAVGIEALSRGAREVHFVERGRKALQVIRANLEHTHLKENAVVHHDDAFSFLRHAFESVGSFDYIYVAPPQYKNLWKEALELLDERPEWLSADGEVIVQIHPKELEPVELTNFREFDRRKYGSTLLLFYEKVGEGEGDRELEDDQ